MKKGIIIRVMLLLSILHFSSCGKLYYACSVSAFGSDPIEKSFCLNVSDSLYNDNLIYQEHIKSLKSSLSRLGYIEVPMDKAELIIDYDLNLGEVEYRGTSTHTTSFNVSNQSVNANINKTSNANVTASTILNENSIKNNVSGTGNSNTSFRGNAYSISRGYGSSYSSADYKVPIKLTVLATDAHSNTKVWMIEVFDYMTHRSDDDLKIRICVPWMLAAAEQYIGKNIVVPRVEINEKDGPKKYGLTWNPLLFYGFDTFVNRIAGSHE